MYNTVHRDLIHRYTHTLTYDSTLSTLSCWILDYCCELDNNSRLPLSRNSVHQQRRHSKEARLSPDFRSAHHPFALWRVLHNMTATTEDNTFTFTEVPVTDLCKVGVAIVAESPRLRLS